MSDSADNPPTPRSTPLAVLKSSSSGSEEYTLLSYTSTSPPLLETIKLIQPLDDFLLPITLELSSLPAYLQLPASQIHVIVSTNSGTGTAQGYYDNLLAPLLKFINVEAKVQTTSGPSSIAQITKDIASNGLQNLTILLSGDTGVTEYLNALPASSMTKNILCILPLGTANAFASANHLTLSSLLLGTLKPFPTFTATFSAGSRENGRPILESLTATPSIRGCVVASYGFHASIVGGSETPEYRKHGIAKFKMVAEEVIKGTFLGGSGNGFKPYTATIKGLESAKDSKKHSYLMMALVDRMEPTFVISPKSKDGEVWTLYTGDISGQEVIDMIMGAYAGGKHVESDYVGYEKVDSFRIENFEDKEPWKRWICVDGRFVEVPQGGWAEIRVGGGENGFTVLA